MWVMRGNSITRILNTSRRRAWGSKEEHEHLKKSMSMKKRAWGSKEEQEKRTKQRRHEKKSYYGILASSYYGILASSYYGIFRAIPGIRSHGIHFPLKKGDEKPTEDEKPTVTWDALLVGGMIDGCERDGCGWLCCVSSVPSFPIGEHVISITFTFWRVSLSEISTTDHSRTLPYPPQNYPQKSKI